MDNRRDEQSKTCTGCRRELTLDGFSPSRKGLYGRDSRCKECRRLRYSSDPEARSRNNEASRRYRARNRGAILARLREKHRERRVSLLERYGGRCACCGEARTEFLAIDHVEGGGTRERNSTKPHEYYRRLLRSPVPLPGYRVLCHNCNTSLGLYGYCPHAVQNAPRHANRMQSDGIADPADPGMLDVVGFDTATPQLISDFARGAL